MAARIIISNKESSVDNVAEALAKIDALHVLADPNNGGVRDPTDNYYFAPYALGTAKNNDIALIFTGYHLRQPHELARDHLKGSGREGIRLYERVEHALNGIENVKKLRQHVWNGGDDVNDMLYRRTVTEYCTLVNIPFPEDDGWTAKREELCKEFVEASDLPQAYVKFTEAQLEDQKKQDFQRAQEEPIVKARELRTHLADAIEANDLAQVKQLLENGAKANDIIFDATKENRGGEKGDRMLHLAARLGHEAIVDVLLHAQDINPEAKNDKQNTPRSIALKFGHNEIAKKIKVVILEKRMA